MSCFIEGLSVRKNRDRAVLDGEEEAVVKAGIFARLHAIVHKQQRASIQFNNSYQLFRRRGS